MNEKQVEVGAGGRPPYGVRGLYRQNKGWQRQVINKLNLDGCSVVEAIEVLKKASQGLLEPRLTVEADTSYGDAVLTCEVRGWRTAVDAEISWVAWQIDRDRIGTQQRSAAEIEAFRKKYPELLKETT